MKRPYLLWLVVPLSVSVIRAQQVVSHVEIDANTIAWRVDQPAVNQRDTVYPEIRFQPKDTVQVQSGGCVQTGGHGPHTWKLYVNPQGPDSDRLYWGLITIPHSTLAPSSRISSAIAATSIAVLTTPGDVGTGDLFLHLGYVDQDGDYGDNGYYSHDDGTGDQCKDVGDAWVVITITHHATAPPIANPAAPMDLWWDALDVNGIGINPKWGLQVLQPGTIPDAGPVCNWFHDEGDNLKLGTPACTTQSPLVDETTILSWGNYEVCQLDGLEPGDPPHPSGTVHGHVNWSVGTYTGLIYFEDWQVPGVDGNFQDNDYDLAMIRPDQAGVTNENKFQYHDVGNKGLGIEFDSKETIDNFVTPWWVQLRNAVQSHPAHTGDWTAPQALMDGRRGIVTGLIGIDTQHGPHAEVHPVFGLAINTTATSCAETWAFMARNWGDEGFCSQEQHYFPANKVSFLITNPDGGTLTVGSTNLQGTSGITWGQQQIPEGTVITFNMPASNQRPIAHGEIEFQRSPCTATAARTPSPYDRFFTPVPNPQAEEKEPGEGLDLMVAQLSPVRRAMLTEARNRLVPARVSPSISGIGHDDSVVENHSRKLDPSETGAARQPKPGRSEPDQIVLAERAAIHDAFRTALGGDAGVDKLMTQFLTDFRRQRLTMPGTATSGGEVTQSSISVALAEIEVPEDSQPVGILPWAFDVFGNGSRVFSIPSARYYNDVESYRPAHGSVPPEAQIPIQGANDAKIRIIGYSGERAVGQASARWDLNSTGPIPLVVSVPVKGRNGSSVTFHLTASNADSDQIHFAFDRVELGGSPDQKSQYVFVVTVNDHLVLEFPYSDLTSLARNAAAPRAASFDGGISRDLNIAVIGYERGISGATTVPPRTGEHFIRVLGDPANPEFVVKLAVERP